MEWFKDGKRNTKLFHTMVRGRRSRLRVKRIQDEEGSWLEQQDEIATAAENFYAQQFTTQRECEDYSMLNELPRVVTEDINDELTKTPLLEEVRGAVMSLNRNSVEGSKKCSYEP